MLAKDIQAHIRMRMPQWREKYEGFEDLQLAVMGCIVNGPGESKHSDIGISLPGTGEQPAAPVFIDGKKAMTLRGENLADQFKDIVEDYVEKRYGVDSRVVIPDGSLSVRGVLFRTPNWRCPVMAIKFYSGPLSLFSHKVEIAMREKRLAFDRVMVPFSQGDGYHPKHPDVLKANPKGQVPVLVENGLTLFDSTLILEYLEDAHPDPALYPKGRERPRPAAVSSN